MKTPTLTLAILGLALLLGGCGSTSGGTPAPGPSDTTPPTVSLGASSTNVTAPGSITLTATASDNVGVTKVEFFDGATKLGEDTSAPYTQTLSYTAANNGSKSYTAKAFDAAGNSQTSAALAVTVNIPTAVDTAGPRLLSASATGNTTVRLVFNEAIVGGNVASNFRITIDLSSNLSVTGASVSSDNTTVTLTTAPQTAGQQYLVLPPTVTDTAGNAFDTAGSGQFVFSFTGVGP
ncbi:MAG: Ig-like domain-containing protein [Meiothermus sp.]|nr:Ig-like domain-containing protein [Meiothermus sp.]